MAAIYSVTAGIFLASILLKEMRYLVYIRYLWCRHVQRSHLHVMAHVIFFPYLPVDNVLHA